MLAAWKKRFWGRLPWCGLKPPVHLRRSPWRHDAYIKWDEADLSICGVPWGFISQWTKRHMSPPWQTRSKCRFWCWEQRSECQDRAATRPGMINSRSPAEIRRLLGNRDYQHKRRRVEFYPLTEFKTILTIWSILLRILLSRKLKSAMSSSWRKAKHHIRFKRF